MHLMKHTRGAVSRRASSEAVRRFTLNWESAGRAGLLKSMGISQPHTGFEHIWSVCGGKAWTSAVESTQRMTDFISYHFLFFFFSAAKEWHASVVCPCCLLGKEYLSSSDRCWHYNPCVLSGAGTLPPVCRHSLYWGYKTAETDSGALIPNGQRVATLILAGAGDDVIMMVLIHTASQKNWFLLSAPCQRHKKEGEPTGLIYGPLVNDDTPSTPFCAVPVHDTSISINSLYPSEGSQSPPGSPTWLLQKNRLFLFFISALQLFFFFVVDVVVLLVVVAPLFNLILFF